MDKTEIVFSVLVLLVMTILAFLSIYEVIISNIPTYLKPFIVLALTYSMRMLYKEDYYKYKKYKSD